MLRIATLCAVAIAGCLSAHAHAQGSADLMTTPECIAARQQLDEVLAARGPRDRLTVVRRQAALKCLGVSIPEDTAGQPRLKTDRATASAAPPNRVQPRAVAVDPIRLKATASLPETPARPGPVGPCTQQGGLLNCP